MGKNGGIIAILGGVLGLLVAAPVTALMGGYVTLPFQGGYFPSYSEYIGWAAILFSLLAIVFGVVAFTRPLPAGKALMVVSISGGVAGIALAPLFGLVPAVVFVACMVLSFVGGVAAVHSGQHKREH